MTCREFGERRSAYLAGEIGQWKRLGVELHLRSCENCCDSLLNQGMVEGAGPAAPGRGAGRRRTGPTSRRTGFDAPIAPLLPLFERQVRVGRPLADDIARAEHSLCATAQNRLVRAKIEELPESYRIVLLLHDIQDMSIRQVAEQLDLTELSVRLRLHKARSALTGLCHALDEGEA